MKTLKYFKIVFGFLLGFTYLSVLAMTESTDRTYFINEKQNSFPTESNYQLQGRILHRNSGTEPWILENQFTICFSKSKPGCYNAVGNFLGNIALPQEPNKPVIYTNYTYGMTFNEPINGKSRIKTENTVQQRIGLDGLWVDVFPNFLHTESTIEVGSWTSIDFMEGTNLFKRLEVRLIDSLD